jgi:hypothetical protein
MLSSLTQKVRCEILKENDMIERSEGNGMREFSPIGREYMPGDGDEEYVPHVSHPHTFPDSLLVVSSKLTSHSFNSQLSSLPTI